VTLYLWHILNMTLILTARAYDTVLKARAYDTVLKARAYDTTEG